MIGRRVATVADIELPGDYCGPVMWGDELSCLFRLPVEPEGYVGAKSLHRVAFPPHVYRECADGSLEVRESIAIPAGGNDSNVWHGYLDEGHVWRTI